MWRGVRDAMESASPTASASTNRGGRPKDWTDPRKRRLMRLYLYTTLPFQKILDVVEEDEFKPGKDAANKVKNNALGNDPRYLRPKDDEEEKARIRGLRNSLRGRRCRQDKAAREVNGLGVGQNSTTHGLFPEDASLRGTTVADSYRSSAEEPHQPYPSSHAYQDTTDTDMFTPTTDAASRRIPSFLIWRNTSRQDSGLTASTDITIANTLREKLSDLSLDKLKRVAKVFKRYTFPKNIESSRPPDVADFQLPIDPANGVFGFSAAYALPGDYLNPDLAAYQQQCAESQAHEAGICWCKITEQVSPAQNFPPSYIVSNEDLMKKDAFGNTSFHNLAALEGIQEYFLHLVCQCLSRQDLPIRDSNTAGQTFLHVLHDSWFQEGSRLDELIETLREKGFDIFACDVYGRNFFHHLRNKRRNSARFPGGQVSDVDRINRRDAFGVRPMDTRSSPNSTYLAAQYQTMSPISPTFSPGGARLVPRINTQTGTVEDTQLYAHADLLRVVVDAGGPNAQIEDSLGRNGFHCLAEVDFCLSPAIPKPGARTHPRDNPRASPQGHNKRKHDHDKEIDPPKTVVDSPRLSSLRGLINSGVDANQYDKNGNTPLMTFVINSSDATKFEKEETEAVITALVRDAGARLELRNRSGDTALHLAARHGKTFALRMLLVLGANPHTRNAQGLSILQVVDSLYETTESDDKNNARFEASRAILTRSSKDAVQNPTLIDEWGVRKP
ncbi:hypothetical protein F4808DRAFT_67199 [Astrocystis sublimbata]|nr:hypothetical protein F4808DRAFT_67199 [Astrocystis sublimbata]